MLHESCMLSRVVNPPFCHESSMLAESWTHLSVTSRELFSSRELSLLSRVVNHSRVVNLPKFQKSQLFRFEQFFCFGDNFVHRCPNWVIQVAMEINSEYYNFHEETFLRKRLLNGQKYPWTDCICLNGNSWRGGDAFPSPWL